MNEQNRTIALKAAEFAARLCMGSGVTQEFYDDFWNRLKNSPDIFKEFVYYMEKGDFAGKYKIGGRSVVDILIWQVDHFKAYLDRENQLKGNPSEMVLRAFDTFLKMEQNPEEILYLLDTESGSDYDGKFN
ncbi:MAG: hypothetical protein IKC46_13125 [Lachnospiraceae bacterium]|nr:hypothetical protein [Lachnospiraceae bacterium]